MLSRRNVRIKVLQVLYTLNRNSQGQFVAKNALRFYDNMVEASYSLYLYNLLALIRVSEYARQDQIRRHSKLRPTEKDLQFKAILADNDYLASLSKNFELGIMISKAKLGQKMDADFIRNLYLDFAKTEEYQAFISKEQNEKEDFVAIYLTLYKFLINHETFLSMIEDHFPLWVVDKSLIVGAMKKTIKGLPVEEDFLEKYVPQHETVRDFGERLLEKVVDTDEDLLELIKPNLNNWDASRIAILDMIIIKMALSEFLYFSSIPTKVTLNEFVELAKLYSTDKSKDFINGILDRLLKKLTADKLIRKEGRGLQ